MAPVPLDESEIIDRAFICTLCSRLGKSLCVFFNLSNHKNILWAPRFTPKKPDSLAIFSPSKAEELKRSLKLREA